MELPRPFDAWHVKMRAPLFPLSPAPGAMIDHDDEIYYGDGKKWVKLDKEADDAEVPNG